MKRKKMRELRDELEVPGHVVMIKAKSRSEWIKQARDAMDRAEKYGATTPNTMKQEDRESLRGALKVLGLNREF